MKDTNVSHHPIVDGTFTALRGQARRIVVLIDSNPALFLALAAFGLVVLLTLRDAGLYPVVFMDEWGYSMSARHLPPSQAILPSYVYSALYGTTNRCGSAFLDCVRFYNALFLAASLPFLYWVAKQYMERWAAVIVAILAVLSPVNSYALYFMPEPVYFFCFWVLTWFVLRSPRPSPVWHGSGAGVILGLMVHVKFNAVFLVAGLIAYSILGAAFRGDRRGWRTAGLFTVAAATAFFLTWIALQTWLVGTAPAGAALESYHSVTKHALNLSRAMVYVPLAAKNLVWHASALAIIFGLPLAVLLYRWREPESAGRFPGNRRDLYLYLAVLLLLLTVVVALFTANALQEGPLETIGRLHMRYYSFVFPLFLMVAGAEAAGTTAQAEAEGRWQWVPAALIVGLALFGWIVLPGVYQPGIADSPELMKILPSKILTLGTVGASLLSIAAWYLRRGGGAAVYLFCFFPILILGTDIRLAAFTREHYTQSTNVHESAGILTRRFLGPESGQVIVISSDIHEIFRTLFHVDHGSAKMLLVPSGSAVSLSQIGTDRTWALVVGEHPLEFKVKHNLRRPGFVLAEIDRDKP